MLRSARALRWGLCTLISTLTVYNTLSHCWPIIICFWFQTTNEPRCVNEDVPHGSRLCEDLGSSSALQRGKEAAPHFKLDQNGSCGTASVLHKSLSLILVKWISQVILSTSGSCSVTFDFTPCKVHSMLCPCLSDYWKNGGTSLFSLNNKWKTLRKIGQTLLDEERKKKSQHHKIA